MFKAYLAGPMEYQADGGINWRAELTSRLLKLGIQVIDPTKDVTAGSSHVQTDLDKLAKYKQNRDWDSLYKLMHHVWIMDKTAVDASDFLIVYCKDTDNMSGTIREMQEAYEYGKPIFLVIDGNPTKVRSHTLHMALRKGKIFQSFDELIDHLKLVMDQNEDQLKGHPVDLYQVTQKLLITNDKKQLLLLKDVNHPKWWDVPGGRLNVQEYDIDLAEAVQREVDEELGADIKLDISRKPAVLGRLRLFDPILQQPVYRRVFVVCYEAKYLGGEIKLSDEHTDYKWVDIDSFNPTDQFKPGLERAIRQWLTSRRAIER